MSNEPFTQTPEPTPVQTDIQPVYTARPVRSGQRLALEAQCEGGLSGWSVRLPVRAERVTVDKYAFVRVEAVVRRIERPDVVHVTDAVPHEPLRVDTPGSLEVEHHQGSR
jgi:stress response protein YsnF